MAAAARHQAGRKAGELSDGAETTRAAERASRNGAGTAEERLGILGRIGSGIASGYFRADVRGLHNIPAEGPVLLVGNHSGGNLTPDTLVFTLAFYTYFGVERRFFQLAHNLVLLMPGLARLRKFGTVAASQENAQK